MNLLILGGTGWLGQTVASEAVAAGHAVTCLARGETGSVPEGAEHVRADRAESGAYLDVATRDWDCVVEVSWQPGWVRDAVSALAVRAAHWVYVSSGNVYARHDTVGADETVQRCRVGASETAPFACPEFCLFFEDRPVNELGWQRFDTPETPDAD